MFSPAPAISYSRLEENTGLCSRCSIGSVFIILVGCSLGIGPNFQSYRSPFSPFSVISCFQCLSQRLVRLSLSFFSGLYAGEICKVASTSWLKSGSWWRMRNQRSWLTLLRVLGFMRLVRWEFFLAQFSKIALKPGHMRQASSIKSSLFSLRKNFRLYVTSIRQRIKFLYSGWSLAMLTTSRTSSEFCVMRRSRMSQLVSLIMYAKKIPQISFMRKILATALSTLYTGNLRAMEQLRATDLSMGITDRISLREQLLYAMLQREGTQPPSWSTDILFSPINIMQGTRTYHHSTAIIFQRTHDNKRRELRKEGEPDGIHLSLSVSQREVMGRILPKIEGQLWGLIRFKLLQRTSAPLVQISNMKLEQMSAITHLQRLHRNIFGGCAILLQKNRDGIFMNRSKQKNRKRLIMKNDWFKCLDWIQGVNL